MSASDGPGRGEGAPLQRAEWIDADASAEGSRVGEARLVKGGSRVVFADGPQPTEQSEAQGRSISEEEIAESGLLQERVIEIGEVREEAVVSKRAVVREELVVRRDTGQRVERIAETLRRTEVDVERLEPEEAESEGAGDAPGR
jgi:hypothetical protein